jgi:hypothetical protein
MQLVLPRSRQAANRRAEAIAVCSDSAIPVDSAWLTSLVRSRCGGASEPKNAESIACQPIPDRIPMIRTIV